MDNVKKIKNDTNTQIQLMLNDIPFPPGLEETKFNISNYTRLPISKLTALGTAFQPLATAVQTAVNGAGGSGLYYVNTSGKTMFQMKETNNYIGSLKTATGTVGGGQAQIIPFACDPTMLFMAATLVSIDKKIDEIKEMQQDILDFLVQKERTELEGQLRSLTTIFNNYKHNWNNEMYKRSNYTIVINLKCKAEEKIKFYHEQICTITNKKSFLHGDKSVSKQLDGIQNRFMGYQLALYNLAFATFLDVILLGNYEQAYLSGISSDLNNYSIQYKELYTKCYEEISNYFSTSIQSAVTKGLSKTTEAVGKLTGKIPFIKKMPVNEKMIATGEKLEDREIKKLHIQMKPLLERQDNFIRPFIENIDAINALNNNPIKLLIDKDNLYTSLQFYK